MMRVLCTTTLLVAAIAINQRSAQAYEAPWCAVIGTGEDSVYWDCQYQSFEACYPNILAGNRGFCNQNPAYHRMERIEHPARRHIRRQHVPQ